MTPTGQAVHLVWDWNGTLLDDRDLLVRSMWRLAQEEGLEQVDERAVRECFRRPMRRFAERVLQRDLPSAEWSEIRARLADLYRSDLDMAELVPGAGEALARGRTAATTQWLLSRWPEEDLLMASKRLGVADYFDGVYGAGGSGDKTAGLRLLLDRHDLAASRTVLIGDALDEVDAAGALGTGMVLLTGASLGPPAPDQAPGVRRADSPIAAVGCAFRIAGKEAREWLSR